VNGKQNGEAIFSSSNGQTRRSVWKNGDFIQWLDKDADRKSQISADINLNKKSIS